MKKLAIVSSYNELCGNATYTEALRKEFSKYCETDVLGLKVKLLNKSNRVLTKKGDKHIISLAKQLVQYDYVNIQFEAGLFGTHPGQIFKRFKILLEASRNPVVTLHRLDIKQSLFDKESLRPLLTFDFKSFFKRVQFCLKNNYYSRLYARIIKLCKKRKVPIIVHTVREKDLLKLIFDFEKVYDHPISFLTREEIEKYKAAASREELNKKYNFKKEDIVIGIFGFIAKYKSHNIAIQALRYLPDNYKLLICGSQHPGSIVPNQGVDPYIEHLLSIIDPYSAKLMNANPSSILLKSTYVPNDSLMISNRVIFGGNLSDDDYIKTMLSCDVNILPYMETNQSGSGNASLTLECGVNIVCSLNYATIELARYAPGCFQTFSIGNYIELANIIQNISEKPTANLEQYLNNYNIHTNIQIYRKAFGDNEVVSG